MARNSIAVLLIALLVLAAVVFVANASVSAWFFFVLIFQPEQWSFSCEIFELLIWLRCDNFSRPACTPINHPTHQRRMLRSTRRRRRPPTSLLLDMAAKREFITISSRSSFGNNYQVYLKQIFYDLWAACKGAMIKQKLYDVELINRQQLDNVNLIYLEKLHNVMIFFWSWRQRPMIFTLFRRSIDIMLAGALQSSDLTWRRQSF